MYTSLPRIFKTVICLLIFTLSLSSVYAQTSPVIFSSSGTFTVPPCVTAITVQCWGAGGGGGGASEASGGAAGAGGGGGGYATAVLTNVSGTFTVTVGAGGAGGTGGTSTVTNAAAGGSSIVTNGTITVTGVGGGAGAGSTGGVATGAGTGGGGTFAGGASGTTYKGGDGAEGNNQDDNTGGAGGGGAGNAGDGSTPNQTGEDANGTGGAGGAGNPANTTYEGGMGGSVTGAYYENGGGGSTIGGGGAGGGGETSGGLFGHGTEPGNGGKGGNGQVIISWSAAVPTITNVTGTGCIGSTVTVTGTLLSGATSVAIGGSALTNLTNTGTTITGTIGQGTVSGTVTVTTPCGTAASASSFTVHPTATVNLGTHNTCSGSYIFGGHTYITDGTYSDTTSSTVTGCDSITTITLTIGTSVSKSLADTICTGSSYTFGGHSYNSGGVYADTAISAVTGCDSITTLTLSMLSGINKSLADTVCAGGSYTFGGHTYNTSGIYMDTATTVTGCDSITTLNLTVGQALNQFISHTICSDQSFVFGGHIYTAGGTYTDTASSTVSGCDSITVLRLAVTQTPSSVTQGYICNRSSYTFNGVVYTSPGTYTDTLAGAGANHCDSIAILNLGLASTFGEAVNATATPPVICTGDSAHLCASTGFISYSWSTGDTSICFYATSPGSYSITATDTAHCTVSNILNLSSNTSSPPVIHADGDTLTCNTESSYQWYYGSQLLSGDTGNFIIAVHSGQYSVNVIDTSGCPNSSAVYDYTTDIIDLQTGADVTVYPNPLISGNWLADVSENLLGSECELFDVDGRSVFKSKISSTHFEFAPDIGKGVYILRINMGGTKYEIQLVKMN